MKTLIINGSPRRNGDSMTIVNEMLKYLNGEVELVHAYYDNISPCHDCRFCWNNEGCCINDDMQKVYQLINTVDNVIIASPIYFSELTGKLLSLASRFQAYYVKKHFKKNESFIMKEKKGVLILTGGGDGSPKAAKVRAKIIFKHIKANIVGSVFSLDTNNKPSIKDTDALVKIKKIAQQLNNDSW